MLMLWGFTLPLQAQVLLPKDEIKEMLVRMQDGWNEGRLDEFMSVFDRSDSLDFVSPTAYYRNWDELNNGFKGTFANPKEMGKLNYEIVRYLRLDSRTWYVAVNWHLDVRDAMGPRTNHGIFTFVTRRMAGGWRIISATRI